MSRAEHTLVYTPRGGMLSTQELRGLAEASVSQGDGRLHLTGTQEIQLHNLAPHAVERLLKAGDPRLQLWRAPRVPGIVTTASAMGLAGSREWLTPGVLAEIVGVLQPVAGVPISVGDPAARNVPAFTGAINFLASAQRDLWHVHTCGTLLPGAVRTHDLCEALVRLQTEGMTEEKLPQLAACLEPILLAMDAPELPRVEAYSPTPEALMVTSPREGISAEYIIDLCLLAAKCAGTSITLTPWRQLCVRGFDETALRRAHMQLLRWRVAGELPWARVLCGESNLALARRLRAAFGAKCPNDAGLAWSVVGSGDALPEAHFVIQRCRGAWWTRVRYNVFVREGNAARSGRWIAFGAGLREREVVNRVLEALTPSQLAGPPQPTPHEATRADRSAERTCGECLTAYSDQYGDPGAGIARGTRFDALPAAWKCPVCGVGKEAFVAA